MLLPSALGLEALLGGLGLGLGSGGLGFCIIVLPCLYVMVNRIFRPPHITVYLNISGKGQKPLTCR